MLKEMAEYVIVENDFEGDLVPFEEVGVEDGEELF